jgi:2-C-methyl-D-erythritol 4-phosphate cytidylyltransferase
MRRTHQHRPDRADDDRRTGVVILAAGSGERLGRGPKGLVPVAGEPMLRHVLAAVGANVHVAEVVVTAPADTTGIYRALIGDDEVRVVPGGGTRQHSARAGLAALSPGLRWVAVTDVARPFTAGGAVDELLDHLAAARADAGAAQPCGAAHVLPLHDSMHLAGPRSMLGAPVDRGTMRAAQTPQLFRRDCLAAAYEAAEADGRSATDDIGAVRAYGGLTLAVPGDSRNIKITVDADLRLAEALAGLSRSELRSVSC